MHIPENKPIVPAKINELALILLIAAINFLLKSVPAGILELGNDEVYYWTYALFPDWSHFDHPPMVGFLIQMFSLNLTLHGDFFIRLGSLILSSGNIIILFYLVKRIYSPLAGYISVILYISSFYFNIISGLFILPDSPMVFFVLLALFFALPSLTSSNPDRKDNINIVFFGFFTGLTFLSKYHALFLWFGAGLYILFFNRIWIRKPALYISVIITLILTFPVVYWNFKNDFISFTFQGNRVGLFQNPVNFISFLQFNLGQFLYQNPILSVIYVFTLYRLFRRKSVEMKQTNILLLCTGIPLIFIFTLFSLFRSALPHWTGPAFICLIILSSEFLAEQYNRKRKKVIRILSFSTGTYILLLIFGTLQINFGFIDLKSEKDNVRTGKNDFTLDMYGWKQTREKFSQFLLREGITAKEHNDITILSDNWFPAAHLDYYVAYPLNIKLIALGRIEKIHKYYWINQIRKPFNNTKIFYITDSRNYYAPEEFSGYFNRIVPLDSLSIERNDKPVKYVYIYDMKGIDGDAILNLPALSF